MAHQELVLAERALHAFLHVYSRWYTHQTPIDYLGELLGPPPGAIDERTEDQTRQEVYHQARRLQDPIQFDPLYLRIIALIRYPLDISDDFNQSIKMWIASRGSRFLWAEGRASRLVQVLTLPRVGINLCGYAYEAGLPVAIFSMNGRPIMAPGSPIRERAPPVVDLVYSLIRQLVSHLPQRFERPGTLDSWHFQRLNGTIASLEPALEMLADLLEYIPPFLICIIDGLDKLENNETVPYLDVLLDTLRVLSRGKKFKFLFTTYGPSQVLSRKLIPEEHVGNVFLQPEA
ncbi:hypothetical protein F4805DRAFT_463257 [Annulohypoxylon moriforme]|nr:hypothetical protein F4805DRAFT_463257 [Annulohypoxylon moriforme]